MPSRRHSRGFNNFRRRFSEPACFTIYEEIQSVKEGFERDDASQYSLMCAERVSYESLDLGKPQSSQSVAVMSPPEKLVFTDNPVYNIED